MRSEDGEPADSDLRAAQAAQRVLVVGINYAPEHSGISPYTTQVAEHYASQGHTVCVFTGIPHYPSWQIPVTYKWNLRFSEERNAVRILRFRHFVPASQSAWKRAVYEFTFAFNVSLCRTLEPPDVVIAVVPSLASARVARGIARRSGAKFVVWVQDSMAAAQSGIRGGNRVSGMIQELERSIFTKASSVIVASPSFVPAVTSAGADPARVTVIPNWTHVSPPQVRREEMRARLGWRDNEVVALHAGNMGLKQGLDIVIEAAAMASAGDDRVRFVLLGDGNQRDRLKSAATGLPDVQFLPPTLEAEFTNTLAAADVLLVTEALGVSDMSLPSKLTSYAVSSVAIVAAVDSRQATARATLELGGRVVPAGDAAALRAACFTAAAEPRRQPHIISFPSHAFDSLLIGDLSVAGRTDDEREGATE